MTFYGKIPSEVINKLENAIRQLLEAERVARAIVEEAKRDIEKAWEDYLKEKEVRIAEIYKDVRAKEERILMEAKAEAEKKVEEIIAKSREEAKELRLRTLPKLESAISKAVEVFWR